MWPVTLHVVIYAPQNALSTYRTALQQFRALPMGDVWEDGGLLEPLLYLFNSKKVRPETISEPVLSLSRRIPPAWQQTISEFVDEYRSEVR